MSEDINNSNNTLTSPEVSPEVEPTLTKKAKALAFVKYTAITFSILANFVMVGYYGFYGHRTKVNDAIISQYDDIKAAQLNAYNKLIKDIPSLRNKDKPPTQTEIDEMLKGLDALQDALGKMNTSSEGLAKASADYQNAIGELASAIISIDFENPPTLSSVQSYFRRWDVSANDLKEAYEERTTSFWKTIGGVI